MTYLLRSPLYKNRLVTKPLLVARSVRPVSTVNTSTDSFAIAHFERLFVAHFERLFVAHFERLFVA